MRRQRRGWFCSDNCRCRRQILRLSLVEQMENGLGQTVKMYAAYLANLVRTLLWPPLADGSYRGEIMGYE
jgi:hypothetical protein